MKSIKAQRVRQSPLLQYTALTSQFHLIYKTQEIDHSKWIQIVGVSYTFGGRHRISTAKMNSPLMWSNVSQVTQAVEIRYPIHLWWQKTVPEIGQQETETRDIKCAVHQSKVLQPKYVCLALKTCRQNTSDLLIQKHSKRMTVNRSLHSCRAWNW